jgi:hypothetical protein
MAIAISSNRVGIGRLPFLTEVEIQAITDYLAQSVVMHGA